MATAVFPPSAGSMPEIPGFEEETKRLFSTPGENIPERPISPYENDALVSDFIEQFDLEASSGRTGHEDTWTRNLYYRAGRQWHPNLVFLGPRAYDGQPFIGDYWPQLWPAAE